jgi:hypothetical protein
MNSPHDPQDLALCEAFAQQRTEDHAAAPAWKARYLRAPVTTDTSSRAPRWLWPTLGAATCVMMVITMIRPPHPHPQDLSSLPQLLPAMAAPAPGLLAPPVSEMDLALTSSPSPTDFLLTPNLTIQIL